MRVSMRTRVRDMVMVRVRVKDKVGIRTFVF